ncbi:MAG: succinylglutamate desuccinylase/aspartoacylase family protein [Balneolaceae bacterium]
MEYDRILWRFDGKEPGLVLVIFVGIHGNETAGIEAVKNIAGKFKAKDCRFGGAVYAVTGNIEALRQGTRYVDQDLNRLWEVDYDEYSINPVQTDSISEMGEIQSIEQTLTSIKKKYDHPGQDFVFVDIHTTSSDSCAFIPFNDTLGNRELARLFPVPQILGIEEFIYGTLLSYINNHGFAAIGFEAGAHSDSESVKRSEAFLWLAMHHCRLLELTTDEIAKYEYILRKNVTISDTYYEIIHRHYVKNPARFRMKCGFHNFDEVRKDQPLAYEDEQLIRAPANGRIFMPLYQEAGRDGFFIIRKISPVWLELSAWLRRTSVHKWLKYLPGVTPIGNGNFKVDLSRAKYFARKIFHLLGYRLSKQDRNTLICYRR